MLHIIESGNECFLQIDPLSGIEPTISFTLKKVNFACTRKKIQINLKKKINIIGH